MTAGGDFIPGDQPFGNEPDYPVVFGIRFTPTVSGVLLGLVGLVGAGALAYYLLLPEWEAYQQLDAQVQQTRSEIQQQQQTVQKIEDAKQDLEKAKQQRQDVLTLFANESTLDTLLLDLNRQVDARNADFAQRREQRLAQCDPLVRANIRDLEDRYGEIAAKAKLKKFEPNKTVSGIITDGSYGSQVNNKLKRQAVSVEFSGNYEQTAAILQSIERLQPLLVIRGLSSGLGTQQQVTFFDTRGGVPRLSNCQFEPTLTTTFQLEALLPLTPEETAIANPAPSPSPSP